MKFNTIKEKVDYLVKNAHNVKEEDYYKVLDSIEYIENKSKFSRKYHEKYENWVRKNIPASEKYINNSYNKGNIGVVYALYKIAHAKLVTKYKLDKFKDKDKYDITEITGLYKGLNAVNNTLDILDKQQINRENIYIYKSKDVSLTSAFSEIFKGESFHEDNSFKFYIVILKNKDLPKNISSEHERIYTKAKKLSIPKDLTYSYGDISIFDFFNKNISNVTNLVVGDWKLNRDDFAKSKFVIKENKRRGEVSMFDDSKERLISKIRNKDYKYLEENSKIYYLDTNCHIITADNSKIRLLCLLYMLEDKKIL